ncbi:DUF998 domain-containing protein [Acrocarpospora corrugata]|uniref:DUF998 domain-containing protein n=1 Tax=Acrocarpospora corrugata TaxID=35763 RepID=UPI001FEBF9D0|nr:DUF998 domain-containing protein [Acrocarpospora corrugata]
MSGIDTTTRATTRLLACGMAAGPIYVGAGLIQLFIRDGFDITRHPLSLMSNGELGWIQIANFLLTGLLTVAGAIGMRRALHPGRGATWGPLLVGLYGTAVFTAGLFPADPVDGFPPGTPTGPPQQVSGPGLIHFGVSALGFLALIAGCFVLARHFSADRQRGWALYSAATGAAFLLGFMAVPAGGGNPAVNVTFALTIVAAWAWVSAISALLRSRIDPELHS